MHMEAKLQELTDKIYKEGVEKANQEAEKIISDAKKEAEAIISKANKDAKEIKEAGKKDVTQLENKTKSELKMASDQAKSLLKQEITAILAKSSLAESVKTSVSSEAFLGDVIKEVIGKWDTSTGIDLNVMLPEAKKKELTDHFKKNAKDVLDKGVELQFESRMSGGFKISPKDGSYVLSFTDEDFNRFFQSFLRPKTKEILFGGE